MKCNLVFMIVLVLAGGGIGCGTSHNHFSKQYVRTDTEYMDSEKELNGYRFDSFVRNGRYLDFKIQEGYVVPEYKHDIYREGTRTSRDPDLGAIFNPLAYVNSLLVQDFDLEQFWGYDGNWQYHEVKENTRKTGLKQKWCNCPCQKAVSVRINGSRWKTVTVSGNGNACRVNVGQLAEDLPVKPVRLTVRLMSGLKNNHMVQSKKVGFTARETAAMNLQSKAWELPCDARLRKYMAAMKAKIRAGAYGEAVGYFEKIEGLEIELPGSFDFQYGKALIRAGYRVDGCERLRKYLGNAGAKGKYSKKAKALIAAPGGK